MSRTIKKAEKSKKQKPASKGRNSKTAWRSLTLKDLEKEDNYLAR